MEYQKIFNLLGKTINSAELPKNTTRKWIEMDIVLTKIFVLKLRN